MAQTNRSGMTPITAGIVGTIAGAVGAAATIALTDEKMRKQLNDTFLDLREQVLGRVKEFQIPTHELTRQPKKMNGMKTAGKKKH
jgi:hypothetical protein